MHLAVAKRHFLVIEAHEATVGNGHLEHLAGEIPQRGCPANMASADLQSAHARRLLDGALCFAALALPALLASGRQHPGAWTLINQWPGWLPTTRLRSAMRTDLPQ